MLKRFFLVTGIGISLFLVWFAVSNYRDSRSIAAENLHGLALSLTAAIENIAVRDPSLRSLAAFHPADIAFFALIDGKGVYRFHSNPDLIGTSDDDGTYRELLRGGTALESRVTLGTGETAYEVNAPLYLPGETLVLRLALHTYRADAVVRRAEYTVAALLALLAAGWILGLILYRFALREERHQAEMARRERLAQLGEMGAMLAHEIRNPLAGIKGYAQVIGKRPREERNTGFAERIVAETLRLENLVNELLAYAGSGTFPTVPLDPDELIAHTAALICAEAEEQRVAISSASQEGMRLIGNRDRLGQVLLNLAKNALQAMPEGGNLRMTAAGGGKEVRLTVSDTGHGIPPEQMERIFEPFYTTKARGTGLGLALCKKLVEEHGGTISVASEVGKGTTVTIIIPGVPPER